MRNPNAPGGGYDTYVRAHARAAVRAGFEPHIFCRGSPPGVEETELGIVHQIALPFWRRFLQTRAKRLYNSQFASLGDSTLKLDVPELLNALESFVRANPGPHLIHGIGGWTYVGIALQERLRDSDIKIVVIGSFYGSIAHHCDGKLRGLNDLHSLWQKVRVHAEQRWTRFATAPLERHAYSKARMIIVNYKCVEEQFIDEFGTGVEIRRLPYASEQAFLFKAASTVPAAVRALEPKEAPLIVSLSRHDPRKGVETSNSGTWAPEGSKYPISCVSRRAWRAAASAWSPGAKSRVGEYNSPDRISSRSVLVLKFRRHICLALHPGEQRFVGFTRSLADGRCGHRFRRGRDPRRCEAWRERSSGQTRQRARSG